jgi:hypothetical protein
MNDTVLMKKQAAGDSSAPLREELRKLARRQGRQAWRNGKGGNDNPYRNSSDRDLADEWEYGRIAEAHES